MKQTNTHLEKDLLEENSDIQQLIKDHPENHEIITKVSTIKQTTYSCEKCCLKFPSIEKVEKHKSVMHKVTLTF